MRKNKIKHLKRKVLGISTFIFLFYLALLIANPSIWSALIPIIIPSGGLTIGLVIYDVFKYKNDKEKKKRLTNEYIENAIVVIVLKRKI